MSCMKLVKELSVKTENKVGMLAEVCAALASKQVNISAINAYHVGKEANFRLMTSDNAAAAEALKAKGFSTQEDQVLVATLENKVGSCKDMGVALREAGIDILYIYGSACACDSGTCAPNCKSQVVINTSDNAKALEALHKRRDRNVS